MFNVARFASQFNVPVNLESTPENLNNEDLWILSEFNQVMSRVSNSWSELDIYNASQAIKGFWTGVFPGHWLEMAKSRLYDGDKSAEWTLHKIVRDLLTVFSPVCPFFTHYLSTEIYGISAVDIRDFPASVELENTDDFGDISELTAKVMEFNSMVWKAKKEDGMSLKSPISGIEVPADLGIVSQALTSMHRLE
jgi:valyl-tRNA synthetase